ncbi:putative nucleotidyltransferase [Roseimaritima multifibrata]|uniref:Putative nucleotidyltransferase n=1 Tax=Roseimaritima multifibrata TaxID=1930274 RepID=A0A517MII6_9BACT|nr:nucleotidyltransferase domain-containing protein [Roseimaritima multifibrata]QDS94709.1 putative nucleotidyltransferase [Roseimaritima multifibrata]
MMQNVSVHHHPLLFVYRVLLTGIHLMRTGEVEANLVKLNETAKLPFLEDLIVQKRNRPEKGTFNSADLDFHTAQYEQLTAELEAAYDESKLPDLPSARPAPNDLLVRLRLGK